MKTFSGLRITDLFVCVGVSVCLSVCEVYVRMYFLSGSGDVTNSRFIRTVQPGKLFQIRESAALL